MFMKNCNENKDVLGNSRKPYRCPWAEKENTNRVKNQSDYRIRYRALWKKKKKKDHLDDLNYIRIVYWYRFT